MKIMTASASGKEFGRYLDAVQREPVAITRKKRPVAVTVSLQDQEELIRMRIDQGIVKGLDDVEAGSFEEMGDEVTAARVARFKARFLSEG